MESYNVDKEMILLEFLSNVKKDLSKKTIKQYIKYNKISVNNKVVNNANYRVSPNDKVVISYNNKMIKDFDIEILYEDKDIIAINKPSGLLSISNSKEKDITAFKMVREYVKRINPKIFLFTIHRLDQDTSGVLLFAKNEKAKHLFQDNWNDIVKKRIYIALVEGVTSDSGSIKTYLKESKSGMVYSSKDKSGKYAITEYKVLKRYFNKTLLEVNILTGRRNQIRVHMSENGHPIIGDKKYGSNIKSRLMLHASRVELIDPRNNKLLVVTAKTPEEFMK